MTARLAAILLGGILLPCCSPLVGIQNRLLYHPDQPDQGPPEEFGLTARDLFPLTSDGVKLHAWFFGIPNARGSLIFAHGNGSNVTDWRPVVTPLHDVGLNVLLFDYRGYGQSEGEPSEDGLYRDAEAALQALRAQPEAQGLPIYYYGQSLGGAVMTELATRVEPTALILQSTFTSVPEMARRTYHVPTSWVPAQFDTIHKVGKLHCPVLVIHGSRDRFVPASMGRRIWLAVPEDRRYALVLPDASHNDVWARAARAVAAAIGRLVDLTASGNVQVSRPWAR